LSHQLIGRLPSGQPVHMEYNRRDRCYSVAIESGPQSYVTFRVDECDIELASRSRAPQDIRMSVLSLIQQQAASRGLLDPLANSLSTPSEDNADHFEGNDDRWDDSIPLEQPPPQPAPRPVLGERIVV